MNLAKPRNVFITTCQKEVKIKHFYYQTRIDGITSYRFISVLSDISKLESY